LPVEQIIAGSGIELIEIARIQAAIQRWNARFLNRIFCPEEINYAGNHRNPFPHYAARYAAKQAVIKAAGESGRLSRKDIKVLNDEQGKPHCVLPSRIFNDKRIHISISHTRTYAIASAFITPPS